MDDTEKMMQQIMEMLVEMKATAAADRKADKEDLLTKMKEESREANQDFLARIKEDRKTDHEKMAADKQDFLARMEAFHEKRMAMLDAHQKRMIACLGEMDANTEKIDPKMMQSAEEHQDVPNDDVTVMLVGEPRKRRRVRKSTAGRRREPTKLNRGNCGSWKKLAAACRKVSRHAAVVWGKRKPFRRTVTQEIYG
jgi:hypothetical protein